MYEIQIAQLEAIRNRVALQCTADTFLQGTQYGVNDEVVRCVVCGTRLAIDHFGPCTEQAKHSDLRLLAPPVAALAAPVWEPAEGSVLGLSHMTVGQTTSATGKWVSADTVVRYFGRLEMAYGIGTSEGESPASATRYLAERKAPALPYAAMAKVERLLASDGPLRQEAAMLRSITTPFASLPRRRSLAAYRYSEMISIRLMAAVLAALAKAEAQASKAEGKRTGYEQVAGGRIAKALSGGSSAHLLALCANVDAKREQARLHAVAMGADERTAQMAVYSVADRGTYTKRATVKAGKVTSGGQLIKPEISETVGRKSVGGRPTGSRLNSVVTLYKMSETGEIVRVGQVNAGNGQARKMRALASKTTEYYTAEEIAALAALQGIRGGASTKKRKAIHAAVVARLASLALAILP